MQCKKSTVMFPTRPCILFACGQELFQQFLHDLSAKGIEFNRKYMKLTKFGILVNKTTLFTSVRDSNICRGWVKILEILVGGGQNLRGQFWKIQRGEGVIRQIVSIGVVWIFSGTTHRANQLAGETITIEFPATCYYGGSTLSACEV